MKWRGRRGSDNIEDARRSSGRVRGGAQVGGLGVIAIVVVGYFLGVDLTPLLNQGGTTTQSSAPYQPTKADEEAAQFVSVVLADTEEVWTDIFRDQLGRPYDPAVLTLFAGALQSPCGPASADSGPFYCPGDKKVYLDTAFFTALERQLGAKGDFAAAYVVAHEVAHQVQDQLGILSQANAQRARGTEAQSNAISVRIELQADCFAGIWARYQQEKFGVQERGDLEEAVNAARRIGDDTLQAQAGRTPNPHTFTHGTSEQRSRWFARGVQTGEVAQCDTFSARSL